MGVRDEEEEGVVGVGVANAVCTTSSLNVYAVLYQTVFARACCCGVTQPLHVTMTFLHTFHNAANRAKKHVVEKNAIRTKGNTVDSSECSKQAKSWLRTC